jgi:hypothetical protein
MNGAADEVTDADDAGLAEPPVKTANGNSTKKAAEEVTDAEDAGLTEPPVKTANGSSTKDAKVMNEDEEEVLDYGKDNFVDVPAVGWGRQLWVALWYKNLPLFQRKPFHVLVLILSGAASVLIAWPAGRDYTSDEAIYPPELTDCGTIPLDYFGNLTGDYYGYGGYDDNDDSKVQVSLNEKWRRGFPVAVMCLGPMLSAIVAYLIVHEEVQLHMLGVLRGLGMPDSVYWASWYIPFASLALVNSFLAAVTAKLLPVHVFEATYLGGILGAFFFLQLALFGASFFLAAVSGTARRGAVWLILLMLIPVWMPFFVINFDYGGFTAKSLAFGNDYSLGTHHGLFWLNRETQTRNIVRNYPDYPESYNDDFFMFNASNPNETYPPYTYTPPDLEEETCNNPLLSKAEAFRFKTDSMRSEVSPNQIFVGCYFSPGFSSGAWSPTKKTNTGLAVWWFIPYFHFNVIWGNICGYTGNRGAEFRSKHARMTAAQLARESLPAPPNATNGLGTTLFPPGSMLRKADVNKYVCAVPREEFGYCEKYLNNCPAQNLSNNEFNFCSELDSCPYAEPVEGVSLNATFAMLAALSLVYVLLAAFWGIVFVGGAGTYPFYFMCMPSYWVGTNRSQRGNGGSDRDVEVGTGGETTSTGAAVRVNAVSKSYGSVHALQPVSFEMARGEVTALLGHNGAGKFPSIWPYTYRRVHHLIVMFVVDIDVAK